MFRKWLQRMDEHSKFMGRMMDRLGVDREKIALSSSGHDLANAARRCMSCGADDECKHYLDHPDAKGTPHFCPNAELFKANQKSNEKV